MTYKNICENSIKKLAQNLAQNANKGDVFVLDGDLGTGKTFFARAFIQSLLGESCVVQSPTYALMYEYVYGDMKIFHWDWYRLSSSEDVWLLGFADSISEGITLVEWGSVALDILPKKYIRLNFSYVDEHNRDVDIVWI